MNKKLLITTFAICAFAFSLQARVCTASSNIKFGTTGQKSESGQEVFAAINTLTANFNANDIDGFVPYVIYTDASNTPIEGTSESAIFHKMEANGDDYSFALATFVDNTKENSWKAFVKLVPETDASADAITSSFTASDTELYSSENNTLPKDFPFSFSINADLNDSNSFDDCYLTNYGQSNFNFICSSTRFITTTDDLSNEDIIQLYDHELFNIKGYTVSCSQTNYSTHFDSETDYEGNPVTYNNYITSIDDPLSTPMRTYSVKSDISYFFYTPDGFSTSLDETKVAEKDFASENIAKDFVLTYPELTKVNAVCNYELISTGKEEGASKTLAYVANIEVTAPKYTLEASSSDILPPFYMGSNSSANIIIYKQDAEDFNDILYSTIESSSDSILYSMNKYFINAVEQLDSTYIQIGYPGGQNFDLDIPMIKYIYSKPLPLNMLKDSINIQGDITRLIADNYKGELNIGEVNYGATSFAITNLDWFFKSKDYENQNINEAIEYTTVSITNKDNDVDIDSSSSFTSQTHYNVNEGGCQLSDFTFEDAVSAAITYDRKYTITVNPYFSVYTPWNAQSYTYGLEDIQYGYQVENLPLAKASKDVRFVVDYLTDVEGVNENNITISAHNGKIYVNGAEHVVIYNANGGIVYSGSDSVITMNRGLYIVKANDSTQKVIVK